MKPEIIIAKIADYVDSLEKEEREIYNRVMELNEKHTEEQVLAFADVIQFPILNLAIIVNGLKQQIREESLKQRTGDSTLRRIKALNKFLNRKQNAFPKNQKAWLENGKMCATNGYVGFMLNEVLEGIETKESSKIEIAKVFLGTSDYKKTTFDIVDVKLQIKLHKAKKASKGETCMYIIDNHCYNAEFLLEAYVILGGVVTFKQGEGPITPGILENQNGKALVFPIRMAKTV